AVVVRGDRTAVLAEARAEGRVGFRRAARAADVGGAPAATGGRRRACSARADGAGRSAVVVRGDGAAVLAEARAEGRVGFRRAGPSAGAVVRPYGAPRASGRTWLARSVRRAIPAVGVRTRVIVRVFRDL